MSSPFPFSAVVGQSQMKLALLLCAIEPKIGGVLLSGGRGSAKSTLVRSLTTLLPGSALATIPLGATEEMVTGSIQLEQALKKGEVVFNPGILARAHQGLLYVDEVNLLPDHLVDLLLDVASSKVNLVERDGMSHSHPSDFVLIGTMNPDEGELRPQLLDRFGLMAPVQTSFDLTERQQIVEQRLAFDEDAAQLLEVHSKTMQDLSAQIQNAIELLPSVNIPGAIKSDIASCCEEANVEGMRADITLHRAAVAHAAMKNRTKVTSADVAAVSELVLAHRRGHSQSTATKAPNQGSASGDGSSNSPQSGGDSGSSIQGSWGAMAPQPVASADPVSIDLNRSFSSTRSILKHSESSASKRAGAHSGRQTFPKAQALGKPDWFRTLIAPENRRHWADPDQVLHLHRKQPKQQAIELDVILLDTSASTMGGGGLAHAKGIIRGLSYDAYVARRQLAILTFGNEQVTTLLHPQRAPKDIEPLLQSVSGGGGTPLVQALQSVSRLLAKKQQQDLFCRLHILTDGRVTENTSPPQELSETCEISVIDIESSHVKLGLGKKLAVQLGGRYINASATALSLQ